MFRRLIFVTLATAMLFTADRAFAQSGPFQYYPLSPCRLVDTRGPASTNGGPAFSTSTLVFYIYHQAFENFRMGYASAIAVVLFVMLALLTALQLWLLRRRVRP